MKLQYCRIERRGPITIVTMARPEVYNALHIEAHKELDHVFDAFAADPEQWVAILTGAGDKAFCAGDDLKWQAAGGERGWGKGGLGGVTTRYDCDKPIIAAVNGLAMGGGFEVALACDLIIASDNASFGLPEPRVGLAALGGGLHRLPRQIGMKRAMDMILTGRHVNAKEGFELGFVNEVVQIGASVTAAIKCAEKICKNAPLAIRASKHTAYRGIDLPLQQAMLDQHAYEAVKLMESSEDAVEGVKAFSEKRSPEWKAK